MAASRRNDDQKTQADHSSAFETKMALGGVARLEDAAALVQEFDVHADRIAQWCSQLREAPLASEDQKPPRWSPRREST